MEERKPMEEQDSNKKPNDAETQDLNESDLDKVTGSVRWPPQVEE